MMEQDDAFHLTAVDVRRYEFQTVMRGYDRARVDQFKVQVADEMERLMRANQDLDEKARNFHEQLRAFRERDRALNEALVSAPTPSISRAFAVAVRALAVVVGELTAGVYPPMLTGWHATDRLPGPRRHSMCSANVRR